MVKVSSPASEPTGVSVETDSQSTVQRPPYVTSLNGRRYVVVENRYYSLDESLERCNIMAIIALFGLASVIHGNHNVLYAHLDRYKIHRNEILAAQRTLFKTCIAGLVIFLVYKAIL